jgi:adenylosuccinate synthase
MREITRNPGMPIEQTSVTALPRRIATFSDKQYVEACRVNRPTEIALTFADYIDPHSYKSDLVGEKTLAFTDHLEELYPDAPVTLVNNGPSSTIDFDLVRQSYLRKMN